MIQSLAGFFDRVFRKYTPDPFLFAILLTFIVFALSLIFTPSNPQQIITYWGKGFWSLTNFTLQMVMILVGGYVVATAPIVEKSLGRLAKKIKTPKQAIILTTLVALIASWINWGFGLVIGALFSRQVSMAVPKSSFRLLIACAYSGFLVWHAGLSGSIPLLIATPGNFSMESIGRTILAKETIFSDFNLIALSLIFIGLPLFNTFLVPKQTTKNDTALMAKDYPSPKFPKPKTPAEKIEQSRFITVLIFLIACIYLLIEFQTKQFKLDLNRINFIFLFIGLLLHGTPKHFIHAILEAAKKSGPILLQFPFFAGIMAVMTKSGLAIEISNLFVSFSSADTFPLLTFYSAGLLNLFVPSGGGQWALQGPLVIPAANALGVDMAKAAMAVAWGDAWTNLLQPFWALPILSIAGISLKEIMGYCVTIFLFSGILLSVIFLSI